MPPLPGELWSRFNPDPAVITAIVAVAALQYWRLRRADVLARHCTLLGWGVACLVFVTPLCALSSALFSARVAEHMILVLVAAPLIASGLPHLRHARSLWALTASALAFFAALWFWHMPGPYQATLVSVAIYWLMHVTLLGSAAWLWRALLDHPVERSAAAFVVGALTAMQIGVLGAIMSLGDHALFRWHLITTWSWGLTPLADQQLGGVILWVPGVALFVWSAIRSLARFWAALEPMRSAN